ncbi:MAG: DUF6254 family protein [Candidatus Pristimantibacillus sp.]
MASSKSRRENAWNQRKHSQHPHGKVTSLEELSKQADQAGKHTPTDN